MIIYLREKGLAQILIGIVTVAFVVGSVFLYGSSKSGGGSTPEEIALTIGEMEVTQSELDQAISFNQQSQVQQDQKEVEKNIIEQYVLRELVKQEMPVTQAEIERYIASNPTQLNAYRQYQKVGQSNEYEKDIQVERSYKGIENLLHNLPLVTDLEIEETYRRQNTKAKLKFIRFRHYEYNSIAEVTDEETKSYFEANQDKYKQADQINLKYVQIAPADFVSDEQIQDYYDRNEKQYGEVAEVTARHILKKVEQSASAEKKREIRQQAENLLQKVKSEIEAGKTFADLAKTHSDGPSAPNGGSLGSFGRGKMVPEFDRACFEQLSIGEISDLVETEFGFHIIKLEDKKIETRTFDEVKQEIKTLLVKTDGANTARELADQLLIDVELDSYEIAMQQEDYTGKGLAVKETGLFEKDASSIPNIGSRYTYGDLIEKAFEMELNINDVIEVKRSNGEVEAFFVAIVLEKKATEIPAFEDVEPAVKSDLKEEKAKQLALDDAEKVITDHQGDGTLEELLKGYMPPEGTSIKDKKIEESGLFSLSVNSTYISNMGACQDAMFKAFRIGLNEVAGPFEGDVAHYIIQLIEREEADMEKLTSEPKVKAEVMKTLLQSKKNEEFTNWYNSMRKRITITDHRSQL